MNPTQMTFWILFCLLVAAVVVFAGACAVGAYWVRRIAKKHETTLTLTAAHGALTDAKAAKLTEQIIEVTKSTPQRTAIEVLDVLANAGVPVPRPVLPETPAAITPIVAPTAEQQADPPTPPKSGGGWGKLGDSTRSITALALSMVAAGAWATQPLGEAKGMDGLTALRAGRYTAAEQHFRHDGNVLRVAECCVLKGEFGEADTLCAPIDTPTSLRIRAISALERGDRAASMVLFQLAAERGDDVSKRVLEAEGTNYAL